MPTSEPESAEPRLARSPGAELKALYRYPVKGLSGEALTRTTLTPGDTVPGDRIYAIENGGGRFDANAPRHLPKIHFLMLMRDERLAALQSKFEDSTHTLSVLRDGKQVARGQLSTAIGRRLIEQFFAAYMHSELRGPPKIVHAEGHSFSDVAAKCLHIVNLASVRDLERTLSRPVNPLRFRANLYLDGLKPWVECDWLNKHIDVGPVRLAPFARTGRCEATNVDPATGARDLAIPAQLLRTWGHTEFGIYARVVEGGELTPGMGVVITA
ncbi:MAG TPA: MOSC domain-containing protein [Hyphomicrobiaceae bacterium]|nr:MOSC domain-containing protein [Hyphomicrobiaceae bacterium]